VPPVVRVWHETAEGVFTIEGRNHGLEAVTLDRRFLSPALAEATADRDRIRRAVELSSAVKRARGELVVLLVGQLTPGRALTLGDLGVATVDRSGAWWRAMPRLERDLFGDVPRPAGECIAPDDALRRAESGRYDLVLVPPVPGDQPPSPTDLTAGLRLDRPGAPLCVTWVDLSSPASQLDLGRHGMLAADGFTALAAGLVEGPLPPDGDAAATIPLGEPDLPRAPLAWLMPRAEPRAFEALARSTARFARAAVGTEHADLLAGLAAFYAAQEISSPFADASQKVELPAEALARLREASRTGPLDAFERSVWEGVARVLVGKRWIPEIFETLEPIAAAHRPWPPLQRALAHASLESFEPADALAWMEGAPEAEPDVPSNWMYRGEALSQLGRPAEAAACFERALALLGEHHELERALAIELVRAGDPEGEARVRALLIDEPDDEALRGLLEGPPPPAEPGFRPHLFQAADRH
jgi:tetratricopeptide (TPR) repeat protein